MSEADSKTDPSQVKEFVERTGCDMLAISVGNVHGLEDEPRIDFDLLKEINEVSPVPLVIHGGSGIPDEHIQRMVEFNVAKSILPVICVKATSRVLDRHMRKTRMKQI